MYNYKGYCSAGTLEQISHEWEKIYQIHGHAVAVPYFAITVTIRYDWTRPSKTMGSHLNVTAFRTMYVL
jgi:hypothetical protein